MALLIDSSTPAGSDSPTLGDDQIRAFKLAVRDIFAIPNNTTIATALGSVSSSGLQYWTFNNEAAGAASAGRLQRNATNLTWHDGTAGRNLAFYPTSTAQGSVFYFSATDVVAILGPGTSGQVLQTQGAAANPTWATATVVATQAEMEAASSTTVYASPGRTQYHPGVAKAWAKVSVTPAIVVSYNVASVTAGTNLLTVDLTTAFSTSNYAVVAMSDAGGGVRILGIDSITDADTFILRGNDAAGTGVDPEPLSFACYGDQ